MKKIIIMAACLCVYSSLSVAAAKAFYPPTASGIAYNMIVVNDDIDIVLTQSTESEIRVIGHEHDVRLVKYRVRNGVLVIESNKGSLKGKVTVFVPVRNLKTVEINGRSFVRSNGILSSKNLLVIVNDEAKLDLRNYGKINFKTDIDIVLEFEKMNAINNSVNQ